jgi:hypothetical protein
MKPSIRSRYGARQSPGAGSAAETAITRRAAANVGAAIRREANEVEQRLSHFVADRGAAALPERVRSAGVVVEVMIVVPSRLRSEGSGPLLRQGRPPPACCHELGRNHSANARHPQHDRVHRSTGVGPSDVVDRLRKLLGVRFNVGPHVVVDQVVGLDLLQVPVLKVAPGALFTWRPGIHRG